MKDASGDGGSDWQPLSCWPQKVEIAIDIKETKDLHHFSSLHLPQIEGSRATGVHYHQLLQCHLGLTGWTDPGIPDEGDSTGMMELA